MTLNWFKLGPLTVRGRSREIREMLHLENKWKLQAISLKWNNSFKNHPRLSDGKNFPSTVEWEDNFLASDCWLFPKWVEL